jgi:hypothetical protein
MPQTYHWPICLVKLVEHWNCRMDPMATAVRLGTEGRSLQSALPSYCICRRGFNSQRAVSILLGTMDSPASSVRGAAKWI